MSPTVLASENPVARLAHTCQLCGRTIHPGERYNRQRNIADDGPYVFKACAHCDALTKVSTVTENADYYGEGHAMDDFWEWEPSTMLEARWRAQYRRKWRRRDGRLYPIPSGDASSPARELSAAELATVARFEQAPDALTDDCDTCGDTGRVDWEPGAIRNSDEDQQPCPDCPGPDALAEACPSCGPGYRFGDEGCRHKPDALGLREEVAEVLHAAGSCQASSEEVCGDLADALLPLIERREAEAAERALREFARKWADWTVTGAPETRGGAAYRANVEADRIGGDDQ